jgi:hypothetical protein
VIFFDRSRELLNRVAWRASLLGEEVPLIATTAGFTSSQILVLTDERLLVFPKGSPDPTLALPVAGLAISPAKGLSSRIAVTTETQRLEFKAVVEGVEELRAVLTLLPADDRLSLLEALDGDDGYDGYDDDGDDDDDGSVTLPIDTLHLQGHFRHELEEARKSRDADDAARSVWVFVDLFTNDGRFVPAIEEELALINHVRDPHENYEHFPLYIVEDALFWRAENGSFVREGEVVATFGGEPVLASASGRLEIFDLESHIGRRYEGHYYDEYMFEVGLWVIDGEIGRIFVDEATD